MLPLILIPLLLCLFNIYRRLTCIIKVKFTKFTLMTLIIALALMLFAGYKERSALRPLRALGKAEPGDAGPDDRF